jgi:rare lipoprotein A
LSLKKKLLGLVVMGLVITTAKPVKAEPVLASWYGSESGSVTASGAPFDPSLRTAAHPTAPFGTCFVVSYLGNTTTVIVNDRGPFVGPRGLDLSQAAAFDIGLDMAGVDVVDLQPCAA